MLAKLMEDGSPQRPNATGREAALHKIGIINVTSYMGVELVRLLATHPHVKIHSVTGRSAAGKPFADVFPHAARLGLMVTEQLDDDVDFVFSALPHAASAEQCLPYIRRGVPVVDLSADFRLKDVAEYEDWYGVTHPAPELLESSVYGLTELHRDAISHASVVGNPGCYPTGAVLALAPAFKAGLIEQDIIVDGKSGVTGAGRGLGLAYHFSEADENVSAYALGGHRHLPEMTQELSQLAEAPRPRITFTPHLIPMNRGILSTCYATLKADAAGSDAQRRVREVYEDFYRDEPFVCVTSTPPQTKQAQGSNACLVYPTVDTRTGRLVAVSAIDNLVKGGSGQAVQNMNLMLGYPETTGINAVALYP
jgi:N-acetyl-gamma-glutamyl-phosphate reductase